MDRLIIIHFGEIWLKGKNRKRFVDRLERNIKTALSGESYERVANERDRFVLHLRADSDMGRISGRLGKVFGISWFGSGVVVDTEPKAIIGAAKALVGKSEVRVEAHRADKGISFTSRELVGMFLDEARSGRMRLDRDSEKVLKVSMKGERTFMTFGREEGPNGLPVGSSGRAVVLLSGGIDSPVASYYAMKRGLEPVYLHVHGFESGDAPELEKIRETVAHLCAHSGRARMYVVPYHVFQGRALGVPKSYELVLFKRFLYRLAERVAKREGADCIVTGESLGQVASQTVQNLDATAHGIGAFIMRPLVGMDKQEIVDKAKEIGTFKLSIRKYRDVCSIGSHEAETRAKRERLKGFYNKSGMTKALSETMKRAKVIEIAAMGHQSESVK